MSFRKKMILCFALCLQHGLCHCIGNSDGETPEQSTHQKPLALTNVGSEKICIDDSFSLSSEENREETPPRPENPFALPKEDSGQDVARMICWVKPSSLDNDKQFTSCWNGYSLRSHSVLPPENDSDVSDAGSDRTAISNKRKLRKHTPLIFNKNTHTHTSGKRIRSLSTRQISPVQIATNNISLTGIDPFSEPYGSILDCVLEPRKSIAYDRDTIDMFNHMLPFNSSNSVASRIIAGGSELASRTMSPIPFDYKNKIILALHGGGSRGYVAYSIIKSLRNDLKLDKKEILPVDMIAGVSVGALVGGVEALGLTEVFDFRKTSRSFFVPNEEYCLWHCIKKLINAIPVVNWLSSPLSFIDYHLSIQNMIRKTPFVNSLCFGSIPFLRGYLFPKYSSSAKFRAIENIFGDNTLADLKTHFCVPVADTQNKELRIIDSAGNPDLLLKDVLQATTAAPTFFNPHCFVTRDVLTEFADGGIVDNNPSDIAFCQAKTKFPHSNIKIISIGNGEGSIDAASPSWKSRNLMFYGNTLPLYMMATSSNKTSNMMSAISKSDPHVEYIEISPTFDENLIKMDMTDDAFFEKISNNALKSCSTNCSYAYNTAKQLLQNARTSVVNGYML